MGRSQFLQAIASVPGSGLGVIYWQWSKLCVCAGRALELDIFRTGGISSRARSAGLAKAQAFNFLLVVERVIVLRSSARVTGSGGGPGWQRLTGVGVLYVQMEYDAQATADAMSFAVLEGLVSGLERAQLLQLMNLEKDWPIAADISGIHPPSLSAPNTLKIHEEDCPFLDAGTSNECCSGAVLWRSGHSTVTIPCFRTDVLADNTVCSHCEQLWSESNDDGVYCLDVHKMPRAAEVYAPCKKGVMKKWPEMISAKEMYEQEIQAAVDVFTGSDDQLAKDFPSTSFEGFSVAVLNDSHVLFADAGRSKNPYRRTAEQQARIGAYTMKMAVLFIRVKAAVLELQLNPFIVKLRAAAKRIEDAAKWTVQRVFPDHAVYVGPLVAADIMLAGFKYAEARYHHQVARAMGEIDDTRDVSQPDFGPVVRQLDDWARSIKPIKRVSPKRRSKTQRRAVSKKSDTKLWAAAAATPEGLPRQLDSEFSAAASAVKTPAQRSAAESGSSVDTDASSAPAGKFYYGVGRGLKPGVYASCKLARAQIHKVTGGRWQKFTSEAAAERYVAKVQAEKSVTWFVLKNSGRDGAYEDKKTAESFKSAGSIMVERSSLSAAKRFLGKSKLKVYRVESESDSPAATEVAAASSTHAVPAGESKRGSDEQFFAVCGGSQDGVFRSLNEALAAIRVGGGKFDVFDSEAAAAQFCRPPDDPSTNAHIDGGSFVVWAGKSTGIMSATDCIAATRGVANAVAEGPMDPSIAAQLWLKGRKAPAESSAAAAALAASSQKPQVATSSSADLQTVEQPTDEQWEQAVASKQSRVFACWLKSGKGRIAFSWAEAARDQPPDFDLSVRSFASEDTLFLNFAKAEQYFTKPQLTIKERLEAARRQIAQSKSSASKAVSFDAAATASATATKTPAQAVQSSGQSVGARVGMSGVVHTREMTQIRRCFLDSATPVEVQGAPAEPEEDELERDLPAPGSSTYLAKDVEDSGQKAVTDLTLLDYFSYKKGKVSAWPLKGFSEFLSFCRQAQRLCASSSKPVGVANAAVFTELIDIAVRVHLQMSRRGTLGAGEIRFKVRMYMHLQYATNYRVLHTGGPAMRAFAAAVDTFGVSKVPRFRIGHDTFVRPTGSKTGGSKSFKSTNDAQVVRPPTGCWKCPAPDHWANDPKFHPRSADGKRAPVSQADKTAILARIEASQRSAEEKLAEKQQVQQYWLKHGL